jgi:hypothetical protein
MLRLFWDNNNGVAVVMTLVVISILAVFGVTFASIVKFGGSNAAWQRRRVQSFYCAEAGLNRGLVLARDDNTWAVGGDGSATHNFTVEGEWYYLYDGTADVDNVAFGGGTYSVLLRSPIDGAGRALQLKSKGSTEGVETGGLSSDRVIQAELRMKGFAIFGDDSVDIGGNALVDSYNSDDGPYGVDENVGQEGNVGSNGSITLHGSPEINGEVIEEAGINLPPLDIEDFPATDGNVTNSRTLTDGTYRFNMIKLTGNKKLRINGDVTIYCKSASFTGQSQMIVNGKLTLYCVGDFKSAGGGLINTSEKPENCLLYCTGDDVKLTGNSDFHGGVYAPNGDIDVSGNHTYYGAIIGETVDARGSPEVHYDEAIIDVFNLAYKVAITSWYEGN